MYTVNNLKKNVLITPQETLFHAPTSQVVDHRLIEPSIIIAEERFIRDEIGTDFYDALIAAKNRVVDSNNIEDLQEKVGAEITIHEGDIVNSYLFLSAADQALWTSYLWKLTAECVLLTSFPEGFVQFSSEGTFHKVPPAGLMVTSGLVTPLLSSTKWMTDKKMMARISPLVIALHNYICKYKTNYPLYGKECDTCKTTEKRIWTGIATSIYDDEDKMYDNE